MRWVGVVAGLALSGCMTGGTALRDRGAASLIENTQLIKGPLKSRCSTLGKGAAARRCDEAKYLGEIYVRKLDIGTDVCLEGGFGDEPTGACLARGSVSDSRTNEVLIDIRGPKPDSRWFHKEQNQYWFEESALVDLYLADHGY